MSDHSTKRISKAERERTARLDIAKKLEANLAQLDTAVFEYPVELKSAGDLRRCITQALREVRAHQGGGQPYTFERRSWSEKVLDEANLAESLQHYDKARHLRSRAAELAAEEAQEAVTDQANRSAVV